MSMAYSPLTDQASGILAGRGRWSPLEILFWLVAFGSIYFLASKHLILTEIAILALFALSPRSHYNGGHRRAHLAR